MKNSNIQYFLLIALIGFLLSNCGEDTMSSPIPEIAFIGFSKDTMTQNDFNKDSLQLALSFADGDGDLIGDRGNFGARLFITDLRTDKIYDQFFLPNIPNNGAVSGEIYVRLFTTCCVFPDNIPQCTVIEEYPSNQLELEIVFQDVAGNRSNTIKTPPITLLCN